MKTLLLFLCSLNAFAVNFAFVQKTNGSGSLTQVFPGSTTAGSAIVAIVYQTSTATVSDTQSNTYTKLFSNGTFPGESIYVALHTAGGANTVTASGGGGLLAMEYSSSNSTYYACVANTSTTTPNSGNITNPAFASAMEVEIVWGATDNGSGLPWTATTGTVRLSATMPFNFTTAVGAGDDNVSSMVVGAYLNTIKVQGTEPSSESVSAVFLNLDNPSCASSVGGIPSTFSIIY